ncbi:MAG: hypothetical protein FVQ81_16075 [Candidatus Glassbacteria bacterium]|nr:hypothetical protein [Candidatus Glassbacteria bacterium]
MAEYCVNKNPQPTGEHEVHAMTCEHLPDRVNQQPLGSYSNCKEAVREAKNYYNNVDGCYYCCYECHTR